MSKFADALAAGYSKQEIVAFLRDRPGYDARINEALSSGYSEDEIVDHLHRQEFKAINPSATDEDLNYLVNDSIKTARKPRQTEAENIEERVQNRMKAGSSRAGAEQATVFDLNLEEKLRQRRNGLDASVRGDIGALGMKENQNWRDANQKLRQDAGRERTWGEAAQDVGAQLLEGGQNISGAVPDLVAPDSEWAQFHKKAADFWRSKQSEPLKARAQLAGQAIDRAGEDGVIAQVVEAASQYWDDPVLASRFVVTNLPSMVPGIAAAKLAQAGALARGATAARAMTAGVVAAGGVNAGLNAGGARGEAFEDIKQTLIKQGMDERQANEIAKRESIVPAMVGGVTGAASGSTGLERAFAGGIGRPLASGLVELAGEQAEEVLPKVTTNLVAGRYDDRSPGQDVGRTMVETAIGSAPGAALASGMEAFGGGDAQGGTPKKPVAEGPNDDNVSGQYVDDAVPVGGKTPSVVTQGMPPSAGTTERPIAKLSEFEQFVQSEREDIARRRIGMVERQAASQQAEIEQRIPSEVETKDAQVFDARQRTDQEQRLADLELAMRSPNPMATFAELRTSKNQPVLPEDSAIIKRRMGQAEAFQGDYAPGVEPSLPDGGMSDMVPERKPVAQSAPTGGNFAAIDNALANGFKVHGKSLVHPKTGKKINLNVVEREYLAGLKRGGNQTVTSPGAEDGDTDQGGQVSQVASRGVEGASAELPGSGRATQAGVSGGIPGDGGRAAVPGGSDGSPVPAGTAGTQGVNEFDVSTKKTRLTPMEDPRVQAMADDLRNLSKQTGWQQEGGRLLRKSEDYNSPDYNEIVGRTKWIPYAEWYGGMATKLRGKEATAAVEKAIAGQPMTAKEKRFVAELADIAQEQAGERQADKQAMDEADAEARSEREAIMAEAELAGLETTDEGLDRILEAAFSDTPGAFTDEEIFGALNEGQEVPGPAEIAEPQGPYEGAGQRGEEAGQDAGQAFSLTGQTPEEVQAEEQARADREKADKDAADKAEAGAKAKRIAKEVESRQRASAENFQLGQSAEDALAGQGDLLSAPISPNQIDSKTANTSVREKLKAEVEKAKKPLPATSTETPAGQPAATTKKVSQSKRRETERALFVSAVSSEAIQDMATADNTAEQFMLGAEKVIEGLLMDQGVEATASLMQDGKLTIEKAFYESVRKAAVKARQEAEKAKNRDPMVYQAALEAAQSDKAETDGAKALFKEGFDHALKGMTKSTLTSDDLGFKADGYEAARKWMKTEQGRAWYEGKPLKREESTGEVLRRHWEMMRKGLDKITADDSKKAWERIQRNTVRADLLPSDTLAPDATGGAQRWFSDFRNQVGSFKDYFMASLGTRNSARKYSNADSVWSGTYTVGNSGPFSHGSGASAQERLNKALEIARAYQDDLGEIANLLRGKKTLAEIKAVIDGDLEKKFPHVFKQARWNSGRDLEGVLNSENYGWKNRVEVEGREFKQPDRSKPLVRPRLDKIIRTGLTDHRRGKDVGAQEFKKTFGFADVTIGEYVTAQQAKDHLNYAFDAFMDLAEVLGIRPVDISFGGQMHFSIGALGHGKHSAHFSPDHPRLDGGTVPVINLTNTRGDGAVAHEWGHALDYFSGSMDAKPSSHDNAARVVIRGIKALLKRTPHTKENGEAIARSFLRGGRFYPHIGRSSPPKKHAEYALRHGYRSERYGTTTTDYLAEALKLDGLKSTGSENAYWSNDNEPLARAFEAFVFDQLKARGARNDYLVTDWVEDGKVGPQQGYRAFPYPRGAERTGFNAMFKDFAKGLGFKDGRPGVAEDTLNAKNGGPYRQRTYERDAAYDEVIGRLDEIAEEMRKEQDDKKRAEQEERDRLLFGDPEADAEENNQPPLATQDQAPTQDENAPLSDDELSALFDEAAAELAESTQEQPEAPAPGEPTQPKGDTLTLEDVDTLLSMLDETRRDGIAIGGTIPGIPSIHDIGALGKTEHMGYGSFETVGFGDHPNAPGRTEEWRMVWEGGGAMKTLPSGLSYTRVRISGKAASPYPFQQVRQALERMQSRDKLATEVAKARARTTQEAGEALFSGRGGKLPSTAEQNAKIAAELAKEAAKLGVQGIDSALAGLVELFGGSKIKSFPAGFDEEAYAKAKPHFEKALAQFIEAGKTLKDLFKFLIQNFGMGIKPYAMQFAKEKGLASTLGETKQEPDTKQDQTGTPSERLATWVRLRILRRQPITWQELFLMADSEFGGTQAQGVYTPKDAYDAVELGVNQHILETMPFTDLQHGEIGAVSIIRAYQDVLAMLPTQTKRTAEMDEFQQFSTPPTYAYLANWVANVKAGETFLEPSAGIGGLAVFGKVAGAKVVVNELSARRLAVLKTLPFDHFFAENAEHLASILPQELRPTVVVMNPPFSATAGRVQGERDTMNGAKHIEQALKYMQEGGRLVAIVGEGMAMDRPAFREWWNKIRQQYNVRANLGIDGTGYAKYGTTFDNQILVIDKTGPTTGEIVTGKVQSPADAVGLLEKVREDRQHRIEATQPPASPSGERAGGETVADGGQSTRPGVSSQPASGADSTAGVGGGKPQRPGSGSSRGGAARPDAPRDGSGPVGEGGRSSPGRGQQPAATDGSQDGQGGVRGDPQPGQDGGGVTLEQVEDRPQADFTNAVFEQYTPKKLKISGAKPHNTPLVESSALATVSPPNPTYTPNLPKELIESGALSDAQLEVVVYAGQAHEQFLENEQRRGFFVGDGTGVGKGREISGIIMDNLRRGRKKAVWISQKKELMEDAKRDFGDIGGDPKIIFGQHKMKGDAAIAQADGILFSTYSLIKGDTKATKDAQKAANVMVGMGGAAAKVGKAMKATLRDRTKQIVNWLGEDFDGVIVFDEAHNMGNAVAMKGERGNKEPSEQALAAVALQNALPKARIVYVSATGATEVSNLAYATRLGLWGAGTPFANVGAFVSAMSTSVSAMELVAQNLKQMGLYFSRSLSFDGGTPETRVTYDRLEHTLDPYQRDVYNALSTAWQTVLNNIDKALDMTGVNDNGKPAAGGASGKKKGAILSAFWGSHQRFFNQVITALQMPSVIAAVNQDLADGYAVVMQIVNTNEADQNRALAKLGGQTVAADDGEANEIEELDLTPREQLITFLEKAFPVQKMEVVQTTNPDGSVTKSLNPVVDSEGKPVFDADAMALRQETIDMVRQITIPDAPLQMVINEFGPDRVAEITGRGERVIYDENGKLKTEKRGAHAAANDAQAFKDGKKDILIFSNAGGTGFSFHADRRYKNQKRRKHYVIQPGWSADKAIQGLGRSHRTNQKTAPQYVLVTTDVPAQKRFISTIARRLESMGALTMGQRDTAGGTMFKASDNLESKYATRAVEQFFDNLIASRYAELPAFMEVLKQMGLEKAFDPQTRGANKDGIPSVRQFLNRILSVSLEMQETMMTLFTEEIESQVELAKSMGAFDDGLKTVHHVGATVKREEVINQDERSGAETKFYEIDYKTPNDFYDFDKADKEIKAASKGGWFKNKKSGHVIGLLARNTTRTDKYGQVHRLFGVRRTSGNTSMIEPEIKYDTLDKLKTDEARALWEAENGKRAETVDNKLNMVVGAILPLWDRFTGEHVNVSRIRLDDGRKLLGRVILPKDVEATLANLNIKTAEALMTGSDLVRAVLDGKKVVFSNQWTAIPVTVSNEKRVEITGAWGRQPNFMPGEAQDIGIIQERIGWQERYFIPSDVERGGKVLDALMRKKAFNATKVGRDEQTKFSRNSGAGINIRDAKAVVDAFRQANRNAPTITVLEDVKKAPNALLENIRKAGAMDDVEGAFHEGIIYVFPQNLESIERAAAVLVHEGRHFAFAATKGKSLDSILLDIYNTNDRVRMATRKKQAALGMESTVEAVEEVLADMDIDTLRGIKGWNSLVAHVRLKLREFAVALRRAGLPKVADWLQAKLNGWTDADVAAMLKNSDRFVRSGRGDGSGGTRMSRTADTRNEATAALGREAEGETLGDNALPKPTPTNPDIRFSRATGTGQLRPKRGPIDAALRVPLQTVGAEKLTGGAWEALQRVVGAYVPEVVKAGVVDDYGLSKPYTDARSLMFSHQRQGLRGVQRLMDRIAGLSRAESAVLYQAAAYEADPGKVYSMLAGLPEESRAVLKEIKQLVHDLGEEEVMLGLLDSETFERNEWAYLHRSYARWELGLSDQEKVARQKAKSIWGDTFRMRGMKMDINPESIHAPAPWFNGEMKGKKVTVLKKARADGKFSRAMVVGAIPEKYSTWTVDGDWEIIDAKKGNFVVRRDYTPDERQDMGEIEDIRFATVKTLQHMMHNVEVAKFFEWVAATEAADEVPEGGIIADPSESLTRAYKKDEWVLVPDSKLTGTSVKRYGSLAGKYVQGPVWNDIRQLANRHYAPFGKTYAAILKAWKISKTALSPAVHMNNVMANLVMADWHDVEATHLLAAIKAMANDDRALIDAFEDNGGSEGMYAISELQREQLQPIIDALEEELAGAIQGEGMVGAIAAVRIMHDARLADLLKTTGPWREAWEAFRLGKAYKVPAKLAGKMIDLYQEEDTVFRLAAFIKAKEDGLTDKEAGKFARKSFLDYQINAPWIQAMRNTAFPFISFTYRALPMLLDTAAHKPWKLLKLGLTMGALNALFTAMAGGDDDEDRKYLPVEKSGRVLGFVAPKLIRMPWNGEHDAPVFLDIRRWIPVGDIVDIGQEHSAIPLLPSMKPGGPLVVLGEVVFNTSAFTGKKITKSTDTGLSDALGHGDLSMERYVKVVDHLYKAFMPNIIGLPGTYATAKVADAATGKTDSFGREYSTASAMASGFGVKVAAYPKDVGKLSNDLDYLAKEREIADNIRSLERQKKRKGISREEYRDALKQEMEKLRRAEEERAQ